MKIMLVVCIFLQLFVFVTCVSLEEFFPFGESVGDVKLPNRNHVFGKVFNLYSTYSFYNKDFNDLRVHADGIITLGKHTFSQAALRHRKFPFPLNVPAIAVFYAPIEVENASEILYRETRNESIVKKATDQVRASFVKEKDFLATSVFIATWKNVAHADGRFPNKTNTFQVVLVTDNKNTFSLFNYKHNGLQWIKGYHVRYQGGRFLDAQVGFSAGEQVRSYLLPRSGTKDVRLLTEKSNVQFSGQWMFKIGWPNMGGLNVEAADSYFQKESDKPPFFIVEQYFEGCFKVHSYLSLSNASQIWQDLSIRSCMILCHQRNHKYAALHNGNECACLNDQEVSKLEKLPVEACDVPCNINDEERCGGKTAASIYLAVVRSILSADERAAGLSDVNECNNGVAQCHSNALCKNSAPGYCCECTNGYHGNGVDCAKEGEVIRFLGKFSGILNGVNLQDLRLDLIAMSRDGRVYVVIRRPPTSLAHSIKILTPFANAVGWMHGVSKVKGVPNGFSVLGTKLTRNMVVSFDSGEELRLKQKFKGKDASGRYISVETTINGTMPYISSNSDVRIDPFKEVYRREDRGKVESEGTVTFQVDGVANGFSVLQTIEYDELRGCDDSFYSFDVESRVLLTKYDPRQRYSSVAIQSFIVNASTPDTQGQQGNGSPCGPQKVTCHVKASCVNDQGLEECRCKDGYQGDGTKCEDADECKLDVAGCSSSADCINTAGSFSCKCRSGFTGDGFTCKKVTELRCPSKCDPDAKCVQYVAGWRCVCNPGFKGNGITCQPDGSCAGVQCSENAQCTYTADNSRKCVCNSGYNGDGQTCSPRDKCEGVTCGANATCDATGNCACDRGFQGDGQQCDDMNECKESQDRCHSDADCTNTVGSYKCQCKKGYLGDGFTCVKEEVGQLCSGQKCHSQAQCLGDQDSLKCVCNNGYQGDGVTCADANECFEDNLCHEFADCSNTEGSYTCKCKEGYTGNGQECAEDSSDGCGGEKCHTYASCKVKPDTGKKECECQFGFTGNGVDCKDLNECAESDDICPDNSTECQNTFGSYECLCKKGFMEVNRKCVSDDSCMDVDCHRDAICDPIRGCLCKDGFQGDGVSCEDENECNLARSPCDLNAVCINTNGSFQCECNAGFTGNGLRCERAEGNCNGVACDTHAQCVQPLDRGPPQCECYKGWEGNGQDCSDADECQPFKNLCHPSRADCINTVGSYVCRCKPGYQGDGFNCISDGTCDGVQCHVNATCFKPSAEKPGQCVCKDGWQGDGKTCEAADLKCGGVVCDTNANCSQASSGELRQCVCNPGWTGNGQTCLDIDECQPFMNSCHRDGKCVNTEGSYLCRCRPGFKGDGYECVSDSDTCEGIRCHLNAGCIEFVPSRRRLCVCKEGWQGDGRTCYDVDECQANENECNRNADCSNTEGSYQCLCKVGFKGNGFNCTSDGSCAGKLCDLNAECVFDEGQQRCACKKGWKGDGQTCFDVNECAPFKNNCSLQAECLNTEGSYECRCRPGYQGDGFTCVSDGSCEGVFCDSNAECLRTFPERRRQCKCQDGWQGDGRTCSDINECEPFKNNCSLEAECLNTEGSYKCRCRPGYQGDGFNCVSDGSCEGVFCDANAECLRSFPEGRRQCKCKNGWQGDGRKCSDINECEPFKNNCSLEAECLNTEGSYGCRCRPGYQGDGFTCVSDGSCDGIFCDASATCEESAFGDQRQCSCGDGWRGNGTYCADIDECKSSAVKCDLNADCFNSPGSYQCRCRLGYQGNGTQCVSDGTCDGVVCDQHGACVPKTARGRDRQCVCVTGWKGDGRSCDDVDECQAANNSCHQHADCLNNPGSFSCLCKLGYKGNGFKCESDGTCAGEVCHVNATCRNLIQGPTCVCKSGYQGSGKSCTDIDECQTDEHECHSKADCLNSIGSYTCQCKPGFNGTGFSCESDGTCAGVRCHPDATCDQDQPLGPVCLCNAGYQGNGRKCSDIDECTRNDHECHKDAKCINTVGSYNCSCKLGFEGDGNNCKPDGTCAGVVCAVDADCLMTSSGDKVCECKKGYSGDGRTCKDVDECALLTHKCHRKSKCINRAGSYLCRCKPGYFGNGFNCSSDGTCEGVACHYNADCVALDNSEEPEKECRCKPGYTGKGVICSDINECLDKSVCPDKAECFNMAGSFMCQCLPGYKMVGKICRKDCNLCLNGGSCTDNNTCLCPPGFSGARCQWHGDASLIFSKGNSIQRMSLPPRPNNIGVIYQKAGAVHVGVDYDCVDQMVYWTEVTKGVIVRAKYDGSDMEVVVNSEEIASPEGIAVDWLGRNIYWTDSWLDTIEVAMLNGSHRRTLISSDLVDPRAIIVDPPTGKMYWADWSRNRPKIEVANMDGTDRRVLVKYPLSLPNGLTLVHSTNELCYSDAGMWAISCVNLGDLSMRKAYNPTTYPFGITSFNRTLFWTDWTLGRIQRMGMNSKIPDKPLRSFVGSNGKIFDIKAVQPCGRTAAAVKNPCAIENGGCTGLCLLKPKGHSCSCPNGLHLVKTGNGTRCQAKCNGALGMESRFITDQQLSANSAWNNNRARYGAARARLYLNEWPQGWSAKKNDPSPWLQIDLLLARTVTAVATQGYGNKNEKEWVKTYVIMTSRDGERWNAYKEGGRKRIFIGNVDTNSVVRNELKMPLRTRWLRIVPRSWNNHIGMRVELYGC